MSGPHEGRSEIQAIPGLSGTNTAGGDGVLGSANLLTGRGVVGVSEQHTGVEGDSVSGAGVWGESQGFDGVHGVSHSNTHAGVSGINDRSGAGVWGESQEFDGVHGVSHSNAHAGVSGINDQGGLGGFFQGNVVVTQGTIIANNQDLVEQLDHLREMVKELIAKVEALDGIVQKSSK